MIRPKAKWKVEVETMDNATLLDEALAMTFTAKHRSRQDYVRAELTRRLTEAGFLPPAQPPIGA